MNDYYEEKRILRQALLGKKLVFFVGAGVSLDSGYPSWKSALEEISKHIDNVDGITNNTLIIPQMYYDQRGKKEYIDLMKQVFKTNEHHTPTKSHKKIVELSNTIITTNYDYMLEMAAKENRKGYQTICEDRELPYKTTEMEIIKMHGDFEHDNIVLKEDDYANYHRNFTLIETYIKSIIATKVILFVGYSFSDPDVKQLFSWVKDVLGEDFQRAYLYNVKADYDYNESEYYKKQGINTIYASQLYPDLKNPSDRLFQFLTELTANNCENDSLSTIAEKCRAYRGINYVKTKYVSQAFGSLCRNHLYETLFLLSSNNDDKLHLLRECKLADDDLSEIQSVIERSMVRKIAIVGDRGLKKEEIKIDTNVLGKSEEAQIYWAIFNFDFLMLKKIHKINETFLSSDKPKLYLQQAYISYLLKDYVSAYNELKKCSEFFFDQKCYNGYFISEFNRNNLGRHIISDSRILASTEKRVIDKIRVEVNSISIEKLYESIPILPTVSKELLKDIYTNEIFNSSFRQIYRESIDALEETKKQYIGNMNPSYKKMRLMIQDSLYFELFNNIMFDIYVEGSETYKLFVKTILNSTGSPDIKYPRGIWGYTTQNIHSEYLEVIDIYTTIRYSSIEEIEDLFQLGHIAQMEICEEANEYICNVVRNLSSVNNSYFDEYYWNCICLVGYLHVDENLAHEILKSLELVFSEKRDLIKHIRSLIRLVKSFNNQNLFESEKIVNEANVLINLLICNYLLHMNKENYYGIDELVIILSSILKDKGRTINSNVLKKSLTHINLVLLCEIYNSVAEDSKPDIKTVLANRERTDIRIDAQIYCHGVINGILDKNPETERKMVEALIKDINGLSVHTEYSYAPITDCLLTLYLNKHICDEKSVKEILLLSPDPKVRWLADVDNYDYGSFDISWLERCSSTLLKELGKNKKANKHISEKIKCSFEEKTLTKKVETIFFRYFVYPERL